MSGQMNPKAYGEEFYMNIEDVAYRAIPYVEKTLMAGFTTGRDLGGEVMLPPVTPSRQVISKVPEFMLPENHWVQQVATRILPVD